MGNYVSEAEADAYIDINPLVGTKWEALTSVQHDAYIDYIEQIIDRTDWLGDKEGASQTEAFPRVSIETEAKKFDSYDDVGFKIKEWLPDAESTIPEEIKKSVYESIIYVLRTATFDKLVAMQEINTEDLTVGSLKFVFSEMSTPYPLPIPAFRLIYWLHRTWWEIGNQSIIRRI